MKRIFKILGILSGIILAQHFINQACFLTARFKSRKKSNSGSIDCFYHRRFGTIRYRVKGKGEPLLLIHGIYPGADMTQWRNIDPIIFQSYKVYALDLFGFGRSDKPNISYSAYLYIRLINDFIKDVIKKPVITAASDYSAAYTVMGYIFDPHLYSKLILLSPAGISKGYTLPTLRDFFFKILLEFPVLGTSAYLYLLRHMKDSQLPRRIWDTQSVASNMPETLSATAYSGGAKSKYPICALFSKYLNVSIKDKLNRIAIPMLILSDENNGLENLASSPNTADFLGVKRDTR